MFVLKCEFCGYEQRIKKKIDKYTYYELTHCKHLWCPCNKCKEAHPRPTEIEEGFVRHGWVIGEWDCILTEEDAAYIQEHERYGWWSKIVNPTKEDIESQQRAKVILDAGLKMLQESEQEKKWMA